MVITESLHRNLDKAHIGGAMDMCSVMGKESSVSYKTYIGVDAKAPAGKGEPHVSDAGYRS